WGDRNRPASMRTHSATTSTNGDGFRRIEVITGVGRRRRWTDEEKAWIVAESLDPATTTSAVARRYGLHPSQLFVWRQQLAAPAVDFRKGMDGLVQQALRADPFAGEVFIFRPKRADRVKILVYDGTGLILVTKRLEAGRFCWPSPADGVVRLSPAQLATLLEGLPWHRLQPRAIPRPSTAW